MQTMLNNHEIKRIDSDCFTGEQQNSPFVPAPLLLVAGVFFVGKMRDILL